MQIKNHNLYELYLCYLDSKNMSKGVRSLSEISESKFYEFLKRYEFEPGFQEKWEKKLLENKRDENIGVILEKEKDVYDLFFETLDENVFIQNDRNNHLNNLLEENFEILFDDEELKTSKNNNLDTNDDIFDF